MTAVKICGITELEQACCALQAGADLLGFVLAPSRRQLPPQAAAEIVARCRERFPPAQRRWLAIGVFANQPLEFVAGSASLASLDAVQLSGQEDPEYCRQLSGPLFKAVHLPPVGNEDGPDDVGRGLVPRRPDDAARLLGTLAETRARHGATRLLLDCGGSGRWGGTGLAFAWETVGGAARDCLVAGGLNPENVATAIAAMRPWGVDVSSGVERDGKKDRELIERFIHQAKGSDHNGNLG